MARIATRDCAKVAESLRILRKALKADAADAAEVTSTEDQYGG